MAISVDVYPAAVAPPAPPEAAFLGIAVDLGPDGLSFSRPVAIVLRYSEDVLDGAAPGTLRVWLYDTAAGEWRALEGVVDPVARTVTASVTHFSLYAILRPAPCHDVAPPAGVDAADVQAVAGNWRRRAGDLGWDPRLDLDGDGDVDILDILRVAARWGQTCS